MSIDNRLWVNFCSQCEEVHTNPTEMVFLLMEKFLLTTGKIQNGWDRGGKIFTENVVITLEDIKSGDTSWDPYNLSVNSLIYDKNKGKGKGSSEVEDD